MARRRNQFEIWQDFFKPKTNPNDPDASCEGFLLETNSAGMALVKSVDFTYVWTLVTGDDGDKSYIVPGIHYVNREGYIICEVPYDEKIHGKRFQTVYYV